MFERLKTVALFVLVLLSLFLTYLLVYQRPQFEQVATDNYVPTEKVGNKLQITELVQPTQISIHRGDSSYALLEPNRPQYQLIWNLWKRAEFITLKKTTYTLNQWYATRAERIGIEIGFQQPWALATWQTLLNLEPGSNQQEPLSFDIMYISVVPDTTDVQVWLLNRTNRQIYSITDSNLNYEALMQIVEQAAGEPFYRLFVNRHLIPDEKYEMKSLSIPYEIKQNEQVWQRIFIDPGITRTITERDGTKIYTDGNRGLQFKNNRSYMLYSDPVAQSGADQSVHEGLLSSIQFINEHGGWNGDYQLYQIQTDENQLQFEFRQTIDGYALYSADNDWFGLSKLKLKSRTVSGYERSLLELQPQNKKVTLVELPGGDELESKLLPILEQFTIRSIKPAYQVTLGSSEVICNPGWRLELGDGSIQWIR